MDLGLKHAEHEKLGKVRQLVLNLGGAAEQLAVGNLIACQLPASCGLRLRQTAESIAVADCDSSACRRLQQIQWRPSPVDQLYGRAIFPLSAAVVLFADRLGGITNAARVVAGLLRFSPLVDALSPPSLLVLCRRKSCSEETFEHQLTTELLCMLREAHPESPRSFQEIRRMWSARVSCIRVITQEVAKCWPEVTAAAEHISSLRVNRGFGLSDRHFRRLLYHAVEYFDQGNNGPFNILQALGVQNPVNDHAKVYLQALLGRKTDTHENRAEVAASCLAFNAYRGDAYGQSNG